jgi:glycosyltransferase involved in cell wall biosynthesis
MGVSCFDGMASSTRVRNLFEPLIKKNLISANNLVYQSDNKEPIGKSGSLNNINFKVIGFRLSNIFTIFGFWSGGMSFLKQSKLRENKNIIYNYNYPDLKNIVFLLYGKLIGYKIIFDIIEDNRFEAYVSFINKIRLQTSRFLFKVSRHFADGYVAISEHLYKRVKLISKGKTPVFLIPVTVNLNYFNNTGYQPDKKDLKIFYGGSFGEKDGLEYLISAFDEVSRTDSGIQLLLTGAGLKKDMERIKSKIDQCVNKDRIIFKGFLSSSDYYSVLNTCDIFCMTRINSKFANAGFPFKLGEFLASGKGVIATKVGDVPDYLSDNVNALLISPNSVNELTEAITIFIKNPEKINSLGLEARKTAETYFDSEKVSIKLLSIFESV